MDIIKKESRDQRDFEDQKRMNQMNKLYNTLKLINMKAFKVLNKHFMDREPIESHFDGTNTIVDLPTNELIERVYGKMYVVFRGNSTRKGDMIDIQPREYIEECHRGMPTICRGVAVPNKQEEIDKVEKEYKKMIFMSKMNQFIK